MFYCEPGDWPPSSFVMGKCVECDEFDGARDGRTSPTKVRASPFLPTIDPTPIHLASDTCPCAGGQTNTATTIARGSPELVGAPRLPDNFSLLTASCTI